MSKLIQAVRKLAESSKVGRYDQQEITDLLDEAEGSIEDGLRALVQTHDDELDRLEERIERLEAEHNIRPGTREDDQDGEDGGE